MSSMNRDQALDILKRCFPQAGSVKIVRHTLADGDSHLTSNINHFTIEYEHRGKCQMKHLVMKVPISGEIFDLCERMNSFNREISLYEVVLPKVTKYLDKSLVAAHLHTTESKILVLEDLTGFGYESGGKLPLLNFNQTRSVLKALAHFHAASHKVHEEDPNFLENLLSNCIPVIEYRKNFISNWELVVLELLKDKNEMLLIPRVEEAIGFLKKDDNEIRALISQSRFKFVVLDHGDSKKDNLMLKHCSNNQVEGVQFIDFQCSLWSSPLLDIFCFFTSSVSIEVVEAHYNDLIDGYLHELNEKLKKLGCSSLYRKEDLDEDFKNLRFFLIACIFGSFSLIGPLNQEQKKEILSNPRVVVGCLYDSCLKDHTFVHAMYGWLKFCEKFDVFESY